MQRIYSFVIFLGFTYAIVQPLICMLPLRYFIPFFICCPLAIFALSFFVLSFSVYKYLCMYVYLPRWESGGAYYIKIFSWVIVAMVIYQLTVLGLCASHRMNSKFTKKQGNQDLLINRFAIFVLFLFSPQCSSPIFQEYLV
jgi:hypothetical protein